MRYLHTMTMTGSKGIAKLLLNVPGRHICQRTAGSVTSKDDSTEKTSPAKMIAETQQHFASPGKYRRGW